MSIMEKSARRFLSWPAGLDIALALLGGMVFGVLAQVAVRASLENFSRKFGAQFVLERRDLFLEFLLEIFHLGKNSSQIPIIDHPGIENRGAGFQPELAPWAGASARPSFAGLKPRPSGTLRPESRPIRF